MMRRNILPASAIGSSLDYRGSLPADEGLPEKAGIFPCEQVDTYNATNGRRFITYPTAGPRDSEVVSLTGAAARKAKKGTLSSSCRMSAFFRAESLGAHSVMSGYSV